MNIVSPDKIKNREGLAMKATSRSNVTNLRS